MPSAANVVVPGVEQAPTRGRSPRARPGGSRSSPAPTRVRRTAADRRRRPLRRRHGSADRACGLRPLLALGHEEDHGHDEARSRRRPIPTRARAARTGPSTMRRHRLDAAQQARLHRTGVGNALQVEHVGAQRAHEHDGHDAPRARRPAAARAWPRAARPPCAAAPPNSMASPVTSSDPHLLQHAHRAGACRSASATAESEPPRRTPPAGWPGCPGPPCVAMTRTCRPARTRSPAASRTRGRRRARTHTYSMMSTRPTCSMRRARGGVGVADGGEVAHLGEQHAEERRTAAICTSGARGRGTRPSRLAPVAHRGEEQEEHGGDDHAHAGDPHRRARRSRS